MGRSMAILDLARYRIGSSAWCTVFRHPDGRLAGNNDISGHVPVMQDELRWMEDRHSKILYEYGPFKENWLFRSKLPKLCDQNFRSLMTILTSQLVVEEFEVHDVIRNSNTGEFIYSNEDDEWIHEVALFDTRIAAEKERGRIMKIIKKWAESNKEE